MTFGSNVRASTAQFVPAFTGVLSNYGEFDRAYPPAVRNDGFDCPTFGGSYANHMGDYDLPFAGNNYFYYTWADNRDVRISTTNGLARAQADVRLLKLAWPP